MPRKPSFRVLDRKVRIRKSWILLQINTHILEIAITTQTPPHTLDCVVHEFIVGKLVFKDINALYICRKIPYKAIFISFIHTCHKSKVTSKNVKQYLISCPTLCRYQFYP